MNLETRLTKEHWLVVRRNVESEMWTNAVLDSIHHLSDLIRNKTGLLGDGIALVGQAFGGKTPKLKLNRLESETEKNIQIGIEQLLRGLYQGIRNPRSHEKTEDDQTDAEAIIIFVDYLLRQIGAAKSSFSVDQCVGQILDDNFVSNERYVNLLVTDIPQRHYCSVILEVFKRRLETDPKKLKIFFDIMIKKLQDEDSKELFDAISTELRESSDDSSLRSILQILDESNWLHISEVARIRTENRLLKNMRDGKYNSSTRKLLSGGLATWGMDFWKDFSLKNEYINTVISMLESSNAATQDYALSYCLSHLDSLSEKPIRRLDALITERLNAGDKRFLDALDVAWLWGDNQWSVELNTARANFKSADSNPFDDDIPF